MDPLKQQSPGTAVQQTLQLEDIHLPPAPGFWPPAPGWWLLAALLLAGAWGIAKTTLRFVHQHRRVRDTKRRLQHLKQLLDSGETKQAITEINILLRHIALTHFPDDDVASLTGDDWLAFLDRSGGTDAFSAGPGKVLAEGPYLPEAPQDIDRDGLYRAVEAWVENAQKQRREPSPLYRAQRKQRGQYS